MGMKPLLLGIAAVFLVSSQYVASRTVFDDVSMFAALGARGILAGVLLMAYFRKDYLRDYSVKALLWSIAAVALGYFGSSVLAIHSAAGISSDWRILLSLTVPFWAYVFALIAKQEARKPMALAGLALILGAIAFRSYPHLELNELFASSDPSIYLLSVLMLAGSYFFINKAIDQTSIGAACISYLVLGGVAFRLLAPGQEQEIFNTFMASSENVLYLLFDVILATGLGYFLTFKSIKELGVVKFTNLLFLAPLFVMGIDYLWFGEGVESSQLIAGGVITLGVGLFQRA